MTAMNRSRRARWAAALLSAALAVGAVVAATAAAAPQGQPVENAIQGAFHPGGPDATANEFFDYNGEPLTVQAVDVGRRSAEPTLGVTSAGNAFYSAANFDSATGVGARTELLRSMDDGLTWESVQPTAPVVKSMPPGSLDPYVWVDPGTDRIWNLDLVGCGFTQTSDDEGETFQTRTPAACGDSVDHQTLFGGPPPEGANLELSGDYPNVMYYCTNRVADARCGRSFDGGDTWLTTLTPAYTGPDVGEQGFCNSLHGHGIVDPEGRVYLPRGHCGFPYVAISEDAGDTWNRVKVSDKTAGAPVVPLLEYAGTYQHTSMASDSAGNLYYVWPDEQTLPWLSISTDHGVSWGEPMLIAPPGVTQSNFPTVEAGDEGKVAIIFVGSESTEPGGALAGDDQTKTWNYYALVSTNALDPNPTFLMSTANDPKNPIHRGSCFARCHGMLDFLDVIVSPQGELWATASDTCEQPECLAADGERDSDRVGVGIAVKQIGGPRLRAPGQPQPTFSPSSSTSPSPGGSASPSTSTSPGGTETTSPGATPTSTVGASGGTTTAGSTTGSTPSTGPSLPTVLGGLALLSAAYPLASGWRRRRPLGQRTP